MFIKILGKLYFVSSEKSHMLSCSYYFFRNQNIRVTPFLVNALQIARKAICCHYWICEVSISSLIKIYVGSLCLLTPSKLRKMRSNCVAFLKSSEAMENKDQPSFPRVLIKSVVPYWNTKNNDDNKTLFIEGNTKHLQINKLVAIKLQQIENWLTW